MKNKINSQEIKIEALEIGNITQSMLDPPDIAICDELKARGLMLSDLFESSGSNRNILLLIGADYYRQLVTGKTEHLIDHLVTDESKLGWLLMGQ